ncbi:putative ATPase [Ochromonadaceae sp. CCMP2298]|nr:putative ATPase [Ochromonadaceae sp. CCMP2298]
MLDHSPQIRWDDIAGLGLAKQTLQEAVILPALRPDLFTGLRAPPKGVLLFGPPGTGKTMLAKAVASESDCTFFCISASAVTSKYMGEGEKLMKTLFCAARQRQPSVLFFDEIDALLSARKEGEHEASRRIKTEFMTQVDGASTCAGDRLLVMAATNLPWAIDEAALRRLARRIYVPLPDAQTRSALLQLLLNKPDDAGLRPGGGGGGGLCGMGAAQLQRLVQQTEGYSGSDLTTLCQEAALGPIRELGPEALKTVRVSDVRPLSEQDFLGALRTIRCSVSSKSLAELQAWAAQFGAAI